MPQYSYECEDGHTQTLVMSIAEMEEFERCIPPCSCGKDARRLFRCQRPIRFHEGWYEHAGPDPVYCTSAQQLADVARADGNRSKYMRDMGTLWNIKPDRRWI